MFSVGNNVRCAGYTLVELLVVLVIVSGMLAVVPPLFDRGLSSTELRSVSREVLASMRYARSLAVSKREPVKFIIDLEQHQYRLNDRRPVSLPESLQLTLVIGESELQGRGAGAITFFSDGSATGGKLTMMAEARAVTLAVDWMSGRVQLDD